MIAGLDAKQLRIEGYNFGLVVGRLLFVNLDPYLGKSLGRGELADIDEVALIPCSLQAYEIDFGIAQETCGIEIRWNLP